jgi:hypothetical protein
VSLPNSFFATTMPHACLDLRNYACSVASEILSFLSRIHTHLAQKRLAQGILDDSPITAMKSLFEVSERLPAQEMARFLPTFYKLMDPPSFSSKSKNALSQDELVQLGRFGI